MLKSGVLDYSCVYSVYLILLKTEVLRRHYEAAKKDDNMLPFIAIVHVRDMILSPPERYVHILYMDMYTNIYVLCIYVRTCTYVNVSLL